jgi:hypothetical protein
MRSSKRYPKRPHRHSISCASLYQEMSALISLRERVAQAELATGISDAPRRSRAKLKRDQRVSLRNGSGLGSM